MESWKDVPCSPARPSVGRTPPEQDTPHKAGNGDVSITCRNRHCVKCQTNARDKWLAAREKELLPVRYVHVVFTSSPAFSSRTVQ